MFISAIIKLMYVFKLLKIDELTVRVTNTNFRNIDDISDTLSFSLH